MRYLIGLSCVIALIVCAGCKPPDDPNKTVDADKGPVEMERVIADVGVAKQGQVIGDKEGILRTPAKALFSVKQRVAFDFKVRRAVQLYDAEHGFKPKTQEEFWAKIIDFNQIELPELPEGHTYFWDPDKGELMVERPKKQVERN